MSKIMQNLFLFMESSKDACVASLKGGNMCSNRLFIDEDAAFELSGVRFLRPSSDDIVEGYGSRREIKFKGKDYQRY